MESAKREPVAEMTYNTTGDVPTGVIYEYTEERICSIMLEVARSFVPTFFDATLEWDHQTGELYPYLWIKKDDKNLVDDSLLHDQKAAMNIAIPKSSQQLNDFTNRFCVKGQNRPISPMDNSMHLVGFLIDLSKIFAVHQDVDGRAFEKAYHYKPQKMRVEVSPYFRHKGDIKAARLDYIEVIKRPARRIVTDKPVARKSFKR